MQTTITPRSPIWTANQDAISWLLWDGGNPREMTDCIPGPVDLKQLAGNMEDTSAGSTDLSEPDLILWLEFQRLRKQWRAECGITSSMTKIIMAPSYQRIIGMGRPAVPLIMRQLESEGDRPTFWSWALQSITGEKPFRHEDRGKVKAPARAWLAWWRDNRDAWELAA
jgi:hypothetical protein